MCSHYKKTDDGTWSNGRYTVVLEDGGRISIEEEMTTRHIHGLTYWGATPLYSGPISNMPQHIRQEILASGLGRVG